MLHKFRLFDLTIVIVPLLLVLISVVAIYTITFPTVKFSLAQAQIVYAAIGLALAAVLTLTDYRTWQNLSYLLYGLGLLLLIAVFYLGREQFGAVRWLDFGFFQVQPSEVVKLVLILILARFLSVWSGAFTLARLAIVALVIGLPVFLVWRQPDLGTASVLLAIGFGMMAFAGLPWRWWLVILLAIGLAFPVGYANLKPYQKSRIRTFLSPAEDPKGRGYNVRQAAIAIGSGGLFGQGLGQGSQSQLNFLPVAHTDFIFAGLAEATGLLGAGILLILYFILVARMFKIAELAKDQFGMFAALGLTVMFAFQVLVNIGMNLGLMPVTGIPLPLVSFGGTALIVDLAGLGILQSIYARHKKITF